MLYLDNEEMEDVKSTNNIHIRYQEHFLTSIEIIYYLKNFNKVSIDKIFEKKLFLEKKQKDIYKKKTLLLDLDETLIHCSENNLDEFDNHLMIEGINGEMVKTGINIRPYLKEFLTEVNKLFEVIVFTASSKIYADDVINYIDPNNEFFSHRIYRNNCIKLDKNLFTKDLRIIGLRNIKDIILVDNAAYSYYFQIDNGIPIVPLYRQKEDNELINLLGYWKLLNNYDDIRKLNKEYFKLYLYKEDFETDDLIDILIEDSNFET